MSATGGDGRGGDRGAAGLRRLLGEGPPRSRAHLDANEICGLALGDPPGEDAEGHLEDCEMCLAATEALIELGQAIDGPPDTRRAALALAARRSLGLSPGAGEPGMVAPNTASAVVDQPRQEGPLLECLAFTGPVGAAAARIGVDEGTLAAVIVELGDWLRLAHRDLVDAARRAVAHVRPPDSWPEESSRKSMPAEGIVDPMHRLARADPGPETGPRRFEVGGTDTDASDGRPDRLVIQEEMNANGEWSTSFRCHLGEDRPISEARWRLHFAAEDEASALRRAHRELPTLYLGCLRVFYGEAAWTDLLDRLLPHRRGTLRGTGTLEVDVPGRLPGVPKLFSFVVAGDR